MHSIETPPLWAFMSFLFWGLSYERYRFLPRNTFLQQLYRRGGGEAELVSCSAGAVFSVGVPWFVPGFSNLHFRVHSAVFWMSSFVRRERVLQILVERAPSRAARWLALHYAFESSRRDLHNAVLCTAFGIHNRKLGKKEPGQNNPEKAENERHSFAPISNLKIFVKNC